ncbi:hypothetical protein [Salisediminibacterium halotolerans]|nr:hypothetical protein [Salisediminibacterium halotolerans]
MTSIDVILKGTDRCASSLFQTAQCQYCSAKQESHTAASSDASLPGASGG